MLKRVRLNKYCNPEVTLCNTCKSTYTYQNNMKLIASFRNYRLKGNVTDMVNYVPSVCSLTTHAPPEFTNASIENNNRVDRVHNPTAPAGEGTLIQAPWNRRGSPPWEDIGVSGLRQHSRPVQV